MRIAVIGAGYVGLVTGACFAELGHEIVCVENDEHKLHSLRHGQVPFYEPLLEDLVRRNMDADRLDFTSSYDEAVINADLVFVCVGTPSQPDGSVNISWVQQAVQAISPYLQAGAQVVIKSTVPVGTCRRVQEWLREKTGRCVDVISNPEFLRQGSAVQDMMHPDRVVIGASESTALSKILGLYQSINAPLVITNLETAELVKYAANAFLAMKISFINELSIFAEAVGADVCQVAHAIGLDKRIGPHYLQAGIGYGGSCLPKDTSGLIHQAHTVGIKLRILESVKAVNEGQWKIAVTKLRNVLGELREKRIAILGLSFKPNTDDLREAPSLKIIEALLAEGATVVGCDPVVKGLPQYPELSVFADPYAACEGCDAAVVVTEWVGFRELDLQRLRGILSSPVLIDGRNIFDPVAARNAGLYYAGIGRR